jgi:hypothetical protein
MRRAEVKAAIGDAVRKGAAMAIAVWPKTPNKRIHSDSDASEDEGTDEGTPLNNSIALAHSRYLLDMGKV